MLTDGEINGLVIEKMIFHVVNPQKPAPTFLAEISPPQFQDFFIERLRETLRGASYLFRDGSGLPAMLARALPRAHEDRFVDVSRSLAQRFKDTVGADKRLAPGVLMFFRLSVGQKKLFAIIKYEHQQVISYELKKDDAGNILTDKNGVPIPDLSSLLDTFTKDKKSLQKSALVLFDGDVEGDEIGANCRIIVIDHSSSKYRDATHHFANFMDMKRELDNEDLTTRLRDAALDTISKHKDVLPADVVRAPKRTVDAAMANLDGFDHERTMEFLNALFRGIPEDSPVLSTFEKQLSSRGIATESFKIDANAIPQSSYRRIVTREGVSLAFQKRLEDEKRVIVEELEGGAATITIHATSLIRNDVTDKEPKVSA